jgi:protein-tyrosine phosphatase
VKWGQVYRSGKLSNLTKNDIKILDSIEIRLVVNFLNDAELTHAGMDRLPENTRTELCPIDTDGGWVTVVLEARKTGDFTKVDDSLNPIFHRMLVEQAKDEYVTLFREIINEDNRPLVFHCSYGIHRTGTAAAILLWSLGVPWETVREDYLLSNDYRKDEIEKRVSALKKMGEENPDVTDQQLNAENIEAFYILQGYYIDAVKETIGMEYGTVENYLTEGLGLTEDEIKHLKKQLLE